MESRMRTPVDMGVQVVTPTVESVRAAWARARRFIAAHHLCLEATIDDYPIGRHSRRSCRWRPWARSSATSRCRRRGCGPGTVTFG